MFTNLYTAIVASLFRAILLLAGTGGLFGVYSYYQAQSFQFIKQGGWSSLQLINESLVGGSEQTSDISRRQTK